MAESLRGRLAVMPVRVSRPDDLTLSRMVGAFLLGLPAATPCLSLPELGLSLISAGAAGLSLACGLLGRK